MKTNIEDFLYKLDVALKDKSQRDMNLIYIMIFCGILAVSYSTLFDPSKKSFDDSHAKTLQMQQMYDIDKQYLVANPESRITQLDMDIQSLHAQYEMFKEDNEYIKLQINKISSLFYDEKTWGSYLHSISQNAKFNSLKVLTFANKYADKTSEFGHVLDINVKVQGSYKNTLKFINALEQSFLVVDLHDFTVQSDKKLVSDLNISVWGIN
jgi:Tfp pilus assembly protein PilO